jgi:hypothetical protein
VFLLCRENNESGVRCTECDTSLIKSGGRKGKSVLCGPGGTRALRMNSQAKELVVKRGTFLYGGTDQCAIEILQTDFRPGTGDYEDPEGIREDAHGVFFNIRYASAGPRQFSTGVIGLESLEAPVAHVEKTLADVRWE